METKIQNPVVGSVFVMNATPPLFGQIMEVYEPTPDSVWERRGRCVLSNGRVLHSMKLRYLNDPVLKALELRREADEMYKRFEHLNNAATEIEVAMATLPDFETMEVKDEPTFA